MPFDDTTTRRERSVALELKLTRAMMDHGVWIQGDYSDDNGGRCLAGWVETGQPEAYGDVYGLLAGQIPARPRQISEIMWANASVRERVIAWNDEHGRTKEQVLALLDRAIEEIEHAV